MNLFKALSPASKGGADQCGESYLSLHSSHGGQNILRELLVPDLVFIRISSFRITRLYKSCVDNLVPLIPARLWKTSGALVVTVEVTIQGAASCPQARPGPKPTGDQRRGAGGITGRILGWIVFASATLAVCRVSASARHHSIYGRR
jgi:hypothetical protein